MLEFDGCAPLLGRSGVRDLLIQENRKCFKLAVVGSEVDPWEELALVFKPAARTDLTNKSQTFPTHYGSAR